MVILAGPILRVRPSEPAVWRFALDLLLDGDADGVKVVSDDDGVRIGAPLRVADFADVNGWQSWRCEVAVDRHATERTVAYRVECEGTSIAVDMVAIPARGALPRIAFYSCNGFSSADLWRKEPDPEALWRQLQSEHRTGIEAPSKTSPSGFHVLLGGGDQVYADSLPTVRKLDRLSARELRKLRESSERERDATREYLELYRERWNEPDYAWALARVPSLMTWDDHDIFDGWGSHREHIQTSPAYLAVFAAARRVFAALQIGGESSPLLQRESGDDRHFLQAVSFVEDSQQLDVVLLDERNDRSAFEVLSAAQWRAFDAYLARHAATATTGGGGHAHGIPRHLVVISSIPVVYLRFAAVSWAMRNLVPGVQELEDDLLDQWEHPNHQGERARLIMTLLDHQRRAHCKVTIFSGDVHAGALGRIRSVRPEHRQPGELETVIHQITSSGIVHPSPNSWQRWFIELSGTEGTTSVDDGVETSVVDIDHGLSRLWTRNWLSITFDPPAGRGRMWCRYVAEHRVVTRQIVVQCCELRAE